jgi:hypothetical protein
MMLTVAAAAAWFETESIVYPERVDILSAVTGWASIAWRTASPERHFTSGWGPALRVPRRRHQESADVAPGLRVPLLSSRIRSPKGQGSRSSARPGSFTEMERGTMMKPHICFSDVGESAADNKRTPLVTSRETR